MDDLGRLQAQLDGELLVPEAPGYDAARRPAIGRYQDVRPKAVLRCASARDVARTIAFGRAAGVPVVARGGGHCFAGRSSTEGLLIDLARLDSVAVDAGGRARIGAGARLAHVYDCLHRRGRTIPAGCGPAVGIAGLTLGGGIGLLGRKYGLTCDALVGAHVVLADGRQVECDEHHEPELFWALRGAGGGQFGVVTSFVFATVAEPRATRFELRWPDTAAAAVITAWQHWAPDAPDDITANLKVAAEPSRPPQVILFGASLRDDAATSDLLDEMVSRAGIRPEFRANDAMAFSDVKRSLATLDAPRDPAPSAIGRSEFFARPIPASAIVALLEELTGERSGRCELNFTAMGGAYNRVAPDATAFAHRTERFLLEHATDTDKGWVDRSWSIAHAHGSGRVYPNFPDLALEGRAAKVAYHGDNLARLGAAKQAYDPDRFFHFPQAV